MRSRTAKWMECSIRYEKTMEDGLQKKVTEKYVVDALSFTEAEKRIIEQMSAYISGEFEIMNINPCPFGEVFFSDDDVTASESVDDKWYKAKLQFITIDEKSGKEKRSNVTYLFQAGSFDGAKKNIELAMNGTMIDYVVAKVEETKYWDVFEYQTKEANGNNAEGQPT